MCLQLLRDAVSVNSETQSESCLVSGCNVGSTWTAPYMLFKSGITYLWFPKCFLAYCYTIFLKIITKMEETKIQRKTSAPVVPVRAHLFTSHAYVSPCHLLTIWILIYIHIPPLPVALHPNTFPMGFAVCISLHPSLIWPRLWVEETSTWVSPIWIPL